jgi:hypothetical protein
MEILNLLREDGIEVRQKTAVEYSSSCPVCGGNDRFLTWPAEERWWCRSCDKAGDLIEYLKFCRGMSFKESCCFLGEESKSNRIDREKAKFKFSNSKFKKKPSWQAKPAKNISPVWLTKVQKFINWSHKKLLNNESQLEWLRNVRGISVETVKKFTLGWNPVKFFRNRKNWGLPEETNEKTGKPKKLVIPPGLVIPGRDFGQNFVRVKIRRSEVNANQPKYYFLPGGSGSFCFYGQDIESFILVESELDAILLAQESEGKLTAVSTGSAPAKPDTVSYRVLKDANRILVSLDNDSAGGKAAVQFWHEKFKKAKLWFVPSKYGKDHTEAFKKGLPLGRWLMLGMEDKNQKESLQAYKKKSLYKNQNGCSDANLVHETKQKIQEDYKILDQNRCDEIILKAFELGEILKEQRRYNELGNLNTLIEVFDNVTERDSKQNFIASLHYLDKFVRNYKK